MNIQQIRRARLRQLLAEVKPAELARLSGVSPSYLSRLKHEIDSPSAKNMGEVMARKLEKAARKPSGWMDTLTESFDQAKSADTMTKLRRVPVAGTAKVGDEGYYEEIRSRADVGDGYVEVMVDDPNAYGIRVRGQSMFPAIRDGWYVLVKPNATPREGEYVLLKFADGRKMVKEFLFRRDTIIEVMSVNGGGRHTFDLSDLDELHPVGALVSPSQWSPG
jgi:phage repressor protein C with HTH and peptisase S24 domain